MDRARWLLTALAISAVALASSCGAAEPRASRPEVPSGTTYAFVGGKWFDGSGFQSKVFYSVGGVLTEIEPHAIDEVIDLQGGYVVPPFGDAHNHWISGPHDFENILRRYLQDGVFY